MRIQKDFKKVAGEYPDIFDSVEHAVETLNLDRRHKWREFCGELIYDYMYSHACSGCTETEEMCPTPLRGSGCYECGYTGRSRSCIPVPAFLPDGRIVKVKSD